MSGVGSYLLGSSGPDGEVDLESLRGRILRLLADRKKATVAELQRDTEAPADAMLQAIASLADHGFVVSSGEFVALTPSGYKAHFIVAA
jgi:predicted transcriptional regulator